MFVGKRIISKLHHTITFSLNSFQFDGKISWHPFWSVIKIYINKMFFFTYKKVLNCLTKYSWRLFARKYKDEQKPDIKRTRSNQIHFQSFYSYFIFWIDSKQFWTFGSVNGSYLSDQKLQNEKSWLDETRSQIDFKTRKETWCVVASWIIINSIVTKKREM